MEVLVTSAAFRSILTIWCLYLGWRLKERRLVALAFLLAVMASFSFLRIFSPGTLATVRDAHLPQLTVTAAAGIGLFLFGRVLIELKRSEKALSEARTNLEACLEESSAKLARLQQAVDRAGDVILLVDTGTGLFLDCNKTACAELGYNRGQLLKMQLADIQRDPQLGTREQCRSLFEKLRAAGKSLLIPNDTYRREDGSAFQVEVSISLVSNSESDPEGCFLVVARNITEQRRITETSRKNEERLRTAQRVGGLGFWELDFGTNGLYWSEETYRIFGVSPEEFETTTEAFREMVHPEDREHVLKHVAKALEGSATYSTDHRIVRPGGEVRWVHEQAEVNRDEDGTPVGMIGAVIDITTRKQTEEKLRESDQRFQAFFTEAPAGLTVLDSEGRYCRINSYLATLNGRSVEEHIGRRPSEVIDDQLGEAVESVVGKVLEDGQARLNFEFEMETSGHPKSPRLFLNSVFPILNSNGKPHEVGAIVVDASARKQAEEALRRTSEKLEQLLDASPAMTYSCKASDDYGATYISANVKRELGYEPREFIEDSGFWLRMMHPEDRERILANVTSWLEGSSGDDLHIHEYRFRDKQGFWRWLHDSLRIMRDTDGIPVQMVGSWVDISGSKKAEEALARREGLLSSFVENSLDIILVVDEEGVIQFLSPSCAELLGYAVEELKDRKAFDLIHPDDVALAAEHLEAAIQNPRRSSSAEFRFRHRDGSWRWLEARGKSLPAASLMEGVLVYARDITERVHVERRLREHRNLLAGIVGAQHEFIAGETPEVIFEQLLSVLVRATNSEYGFISEVLYDPAGQPYRQCRAITNAAWGEESRRFCEEHGSTGMGFRDLKNLLGAILTSGKPVIANNPATDPRSAGPPDGHPPLNSFLGVPLFHGAKLVGALGVANRPHGYGASLLQFIEPLISVCAATIVALRSSREQERAEKKLRQQTAFLSSVLNNIHTGIVVCDASGILTLFNRASREFHGLAEKPLASESWAEHYGLYQEDGKTLMPSEAVPLWRAFQGEQIKNLEMTIVPKRGPVRRILASGSPLRAEDGEKLGAVVALHDITELKQARQEKEEVESQLRHAQQLESLGTLAGGIAHDINNILTPILGFTEMVKSNLPDNSQDAKNLEQVLRAGARGKHLIRQILLFSRMQEEALTLIDPVPVIKEALQMLRAAIPANIEIRSTIDAGRDRILADPAQLHQVVANLCVNAYQAMSPGSGVITVSLRRIEVDEQTARALGGLTEGPYVRLRVRDTGPGMSPETAARIFDPFFTTKGPTQGTGLGLPVVHGIALRHGGMISAESEPGEGAQFDVHFPVLEGEEADKPIAAEPPPSGEEHILFVDDEQANAELGQQMLERLGYRVTVHTSSFEALEDFRRNSESIKIAVIDITMPQMGGTELAQKLREIRSDIPIVFVTGYSEVMTPEKAEAMGIRAYIMKPFTQGDLATTVRRVLDAA